ncbi:MAG: hypothetical protein WCL71_07780 [Deltaproteobacteria bacterium]
METKLESCGPLRAASRSGSWELERTHGRLVRCIYENGCAEAEAYLQNLRADGWKAWSLSSVGNHVTEVLTLPYTNTSHEKLLPVLERLNRAIVARMSADDPTGEERLELLRASKEASEILRQNDKGLATQPAPQMPEKHK